MIRHLLIYVLFSLCISCNQPSYIGEWIAQTDSASVHLTLQAHAYSFTKTYAHRHYLEKGKIMVRQDSIWFVPVYFWEERYERWLLLTKPKAKGYRFLIDDERLIWMDRTDTLFWEKKEILK